MAKIVLSYGFLPSKVAFQKQFREEVGSGGYHYEFKGEDAETAQAFDLAPEGTVNADQLYEMVKTLTEGADEDEGAGDLASGILSTLSIEWV